MKKIQWIILAITIIAAFTLISILLFRFVDVRAASIYTAAGTLVLAAATIVLSLFTWHSVRSADERDRKNREEAIAKEERDLQERILYEIINWVMDVAFFGVTEYSNIAILSNEPKAYITEYKKINILGYGAIYVRGERVEKVAEELNGNLVNDVMKIRGQIQDYIKYLNTTRRIKTFFKEDTKFRNGLNEKATGILQQLQT